MKKNKLSVRGRMPGAALIIRIHGAAAHYWAKEYRYLPPNTVGTSRRSK